MPKCTANRQIWVKDGERWVNLHEYTYSCGDRVVVVRAPPCGRKGQFTDNTLTKFVLPLGGEPRFIRRDKAYPNDPPFDVMQTRWQRWAQVYLAEVA